MKKTFRIGNMETNHRSESQVSIITNKLRKVTLGEIERFIIAFTIVIAFENEKIKFSLFSKVTNLVEFQSKPGNMNNFSCICYQNQNI